MQYRANFIRVVVDKLSDFFNWEIFPILPELLFKVTPGVLTFVFVVKPL